MPTEGHSTIMAGLAEFERDLIRDRVKSGLVAARPGASNLGARWGSVPRTRKPSGCSACMPTGCPIGSLPRNVGFEQEHGDGHCQAELRRALSQRSFQSGGGGRVHPHRPTIRAAAAAASGNWWSPDTPEASKNLVEVAGFDPGCVKTCTEQKSLESYSDSPPVQRLPRHIVSEGMT